MHNWTGIRKRRIREHVIEEMSANFLERKVLQRGHMLVRAPQRKYGWGRQNVRKRHQSSATRTAVRPWVRDARQR